MTDVFRPLPNLVVINCEFNCIHMYDVAHVAINLKLRTFQIQITLNEKSHPYIMILPWLFALN